jgi:hypothetical protein
LPFRRSRHQSYLLSTIIPIDNRAVQSSSFPDKNSTHFKLGFWHKICSYASVTFGVISDSICSPVALACRVRMLHALFKQQGQQEPFRALTLVLTGTDILAMPPLNCYDKSFLSPAIG